MAGLTDDTIGGFNSFVEQQKKEPGDANITVVLFDDKYDVLRNRVNIKEVPAMTDKEYFARGTTSLLDAIGKAINSLGERLRNMQEEDRPDKVIFVITTDGMENSSREFSHLQIKNMIEHQTNVYNWKFIFLGANIDAAAVGDSIGINQGNTAQYSATEIGTQSLYGAVAKAVTTYRSNGDVDENWKEDVE
jgi:uncharacterized protein YegL